MGSALAGPIGLVSLMVRWCVGWWWLGLWLVQWVGWLMGRWVGPLVGWLVGAPVDIPVSWSV